MAQKKNKLSSIIYKTKSIASGMFTDDQVEIISNRYALISGCKKLTEYSSEKIALSFRDMKIEIKGKDLEPESLLNGQMAVKGLIHEVIYLDN